MKNLVSRSLKKVQSKKGFTLVELIVVIAILAILAAVLIPAINGWVQKAGVSAAKNNASTVKSAASIMFTEAESGEATKADGTEVTVDTSKGITITKAAKATPTSTTTNAADVFNKLATNIPTDDTFTITVSSQGTISGTYTSGKNTVDLATGELKDAE